MVPYIVKHVILSHILITIHCYKLFAISQLQHYLIVTTFFVDLDIIEI